MRRAELLAAAAAIANVAANIVRYVAEDGGDDPNEHLPVDVAAGIAGVSVRTLSKACRLGDPEWFGKQRSRTIRRGDLSAWIESRRAPVLPGTVDADIERRMRKLRAKRKAAGPSVAAASPRAARRSA